jgi:LuxR family maltose regulon positive regulatory protein
MREAIVHALEADYSYAASLIEQAAPVFWLNGEARTIQNWVLTLPDAALCDHTRLALDAMLYSLNSVQMSTEQMHASVVALVEQTILRIETILHRKPGPVLSHVQVEFIERRLHLLSALIESRTIHMRGDRERLRILCRELEALPPDEEVRWNLITLSLTFLLTHVLRGEGAILVSRLREARQQVTEAGDHLGTIRVMHMLALAYLKAGQLHLAHQLVLEGLALVEQVGGHTWEVGYLQYTLFEIYYSWNCLQEASDTLHRLLRTAQDWHHVDLLSAGELVRVQISLARGDLVTAQQALQRLEALVEQERFTKHATWLASAQIQYWLASGNLARALGWATQTTFSLQPSANPLHEWEMFMLVRVSLAQQQYTRALEMLSCFKERLDRLEDIDTTVHFLALWVLALHLAGKGAQAVQVAARLLALTEPQGHVRCYLDLGEPMKQFLLTLLAPPHEQPEPAHHAAALSHFFIVKLLAAFEQEEKQGSISAMTAPLESKTITEAKQLPVVSATPIEPLTQREQEVLRWLSSGASNQEIAKALVIQISTVKKHVSNLFDKLGVANRSQAIARVRRDRLL